MHLVDIIYHIIYFRLSRCSLFVAMLYHILPCSTNIIDTHDLATRVLVAM